MEGLEAGGFGSVGLWGQKMCSGPGVSMREGSPTEGLWVSSGCAPQG